MTPLYFWRTKQRRVAATACTIFCFKVAIGADLVLFTTDPNAWHEFMSRTWTCAWVVMSRTSGSLDFLVVILYCESWLAVCDERFSLFTAISHWDFDLSLSSFVHEAILVSVAAIQSSVLRGCSRKSRKSKERYVCEMRVFCGFT